MGKNDLLKLVPSIFPFLIFSAFLSAQTNAYTWAFKKFDKNGNGEITFRELKCNGFFKFDKNNNLKLSRYEFWRLKRYQKKELKKFEKLLKRGAFAKYYRHALEPLIAYKPAADTYQELNRFKK